MSILDTLLRRKPAPSPAPTLAASPTRFGYAVIGLGGIANHFLNYMQSSTAVRVTALVSGDIAKANKLAAKFNVPHALTYADFDKLRDLPHVDAVYIALPVSLHREYTQRAAALGLHVLCEKPMAPTAADARAMIAACADADVHLSIATRPPYSAVHRRARQLIASGELGRITHIESSFGFNLKSSRGETSWRANPTLAGGGSLYDVGIYPLNAARFLLGEEPATHTISNIVREGATEMSISWQSHFPSGAVLSARSSFLESLSDTVGITGTNGTLLIDPAFGHRKPFRLTGTVNGTSIDEQPAEPNTFVLEAEDLARAAIDNTPTLTPGQDGLADLVAMEAIYAAAAGR